MDYLTWWLDTIVLPMLYLAGSLAIVVGGFFLMLFVIALPNLIGSWLFTSSDKRTFMEMAKEEW